MKKLAVLAMRRSVILAAVMATLLAIPAAAGAVDADDDYTGIWTAVDVDGSNMILFVTDVGGGQVSMTLLDNGGSFCGTFNPRGRPIVPLIATGTGTVNGTLVVNFDIVCVNGVSGPSGLVTYTLGVDRMTMSDSSGVTGWTLRADF